MTHQSSRRNFLQSTAAVAAGLYVGNSAKAEDKKSKSPNEEPVIAFVGTGIRYHTYHARKAMEYGPCAAISDVDQLQMGRALQVAVDVHRSKNRELVIDTYEDYRRILDRKDIDVIVMGAVDHWHTKITIDAMNAGKDVYAEKPLTLTIREGQQILEAEKRTGRVVQVGTQQRTEFNKRFATAAAMLRDNRVGDLKELTVCIGGSRDSGHLPVAKVPKALNWDMWLGQCPMVDYRAASEVVDKTGWGAGFPFGRAHHYYRWFYEYSGGKLTDWGAHHVDIAMWALDKMGDDIGPIKIEPEQVHHPVEFKDGYPVKDDRFNCAISFKVKCTFADGTVMYVRDDASKDKGFNNGIMFEGSKGKYLVNRGKLVGKPVEDLKENPLSDCALGKLYVDDPTETEGYGNDGFHMKNFMECVKTRKKPASDVQSHHRMLNVCHAINIAMRLGRPVTFDPKTETFGDDKLANSFVAREQREGYEIA